MRDVVGAIRSHTSTGVDSIDRAVDGIGTGYLVGGMSEDEMDDMEETVDRLKRWQVVEEEALAGGEGGQVTTTEGQSSGVSKSGRVGDFDDSLQGSEQDGYDDDYVDP